MLFCNRLTPLTIHTFSLIFTVDIRKIFCHYNSVAEQQSSLFFISAFDPCSVVFLYEVKKQSRKTGPAPRLEAFRATLSKQKYKAILQCRLPISPNIVLFTSRNDTLNFQGMLKCISCIPSPQFLFVLHAAYIDSFSH